MPGWGTSSTATGTLVGAFVVSLLLPIPDRATALKAIKLVSSRAANAVVIAGNSVLTHTSRCDADRTTLADLMSTELDGRVINLSNPGQSFAESAAYLALALRQDNVRTAVFMLAVDQLAAHEWPSLQTQLFLSQSGRLALESNSFSARFAHGFYLAGGREEATRFTYQGVHYPDYDGLKQYFAREKQAMGCPETLGSQRQFIEAYYWQQHLSARCVERNERDLAALSAHARSLGKRFLVVLMPVDVQDVQDLNPQLALQLEAQLADRARAIAEAGTELLDLSHAPSAASFADRWCACGHLAAPGRSWVSARVSDYLRAHPERSKAMIPQARRD